MINYFLNTDAGGQAKIVVSDPARQIVRQVDGPAERGLNRALVSLAREAGAAQAEPRDNAVEGRQRHRPSLWATTPSRSMVLASR